MKRIALMTTLTIAFGIGAEAAAAQAQAPDRRVADFVKTGKVRTCLGMNPTLAFKDPATGQLRGPALELARALANRMGVEVATVEYPSPGAVMQGMEAKACDLTFLVIDPARATIVDFSSTYMQSDFTYLVSERSVVRSVAEADRPGIRIAVVRNDASDLRLTKLVKQAELVRADDISSAVELLRGGQADAVAAPRPVLLVQSAKLNGSRVLGDGFAAISYAAVVPKGNDEWLAYVNQFIEEAKASGLVKQTIESAGLRGVQVAAGGT